ncbi:MAG TPA: farnesyl diphosphate synthase [Virgibacillus sp.]|nr:farnesyl diphosphate synthase [Virgibacillus sp.]
MVEHNLDDYIEQNKAIIHREIRKYLDELAIPERLKSAMIYSIEAGGKKIRPILLIASYEAYGQDKDKVISTAVALEMIHTYSLIHDDLPAMDDDDLRRGYPTNHIQFDEATAILAGDALLTYSFEIIANDPKLSSDEKVEVMQMLSSHSGPKGMVSGQILDMEAEKNPVSLAELENIHNLKTGKLLSFAITSGAYLSKATTEQMKHLSTFSYYLGLIFQVQDDILDVAGDASKIGKPVGSDSNNAKSTYPKLLGMDGAIKQKQIYVDQAKEALQQAGAVESYLFLLTDYLTQRDH